MKQIEMLQDDRLAEDEPLYKGTIYHLSDSKADELITNGKGKEVHIS